VRQIAPGFPQSGNNVSWMVTIVSLTGAATLALSGRIADLWGKTYVRRPSTRGPAGGLYG
jgi:hypothetical protein